jgi:hypothetical protein
MIPTDTGWMLQNPFGVVPGHKGIDDNEIANQLAKMGSLHTLTWFEPTWGFSGRVTGWAIR